MSTALELMRPNWAEIDLDAFDRNVDALRARLPEGARLCLVLKANAYGHGAVRLAQSLTPEKCAMIAVALLEEALELRDAGITLPVLVLGAMTPQQVPLAAERGIVIGVPSPEALEAAAAASKDRHVTVHLKLDSGMGRVGLLPADLEAAAKVIRSAPRLKVDAIYTHFANSPDPDDTYTQRQVARFDEMVAALRALGVDAPMHHLVNSGAYMRGIKPGDLMRIGIALYGAEPVEHRHDRLEPLLRWRTEVVRVKTLPAGAPVGYSLTWRGDRESRIATIAVGYADGYNRGLSSRGTVLVHGMRAPVVGRVSMDLVTIDVTDIPDVEVGDEVVLLGRQEDEEVSAEEIANLLGTISYEVLCAVGARVPRLYRTGGDPEVDSRFD